MCVRVLCSVLFIVGLEINFGIATSDPSRCIHRSTSNSAVIQPQYCLTKETDIKPSCPPSRKVVLISLQIAMKSDTDLCTKRIVAPEHEYCCYVQQNDVLYDSQCLQEVWNNEDKIHYQDFINRALNKCTNQSGCVLSSEMFSSIQREIPSSNKYSSYFQVAYQCIKAPTSPIRFCSSQTRSGKEFHFQGRSGEYVNQTCTCHVTSQSDGDVKVKAVDVRTLHSRLILRSNGKFKNISYGNTALFGFKEIFSDKKISIIVNLGSTHPADNIWLHVSGSNGKDVNVTCGETVTRVESTSILLNQISHLPKKTVFMGYWPLIYVASGSIVTLFVLACVIGSIVFCRNGGRKTKRLQHTCHHHSLPSPADFHQDPYNLPYATVLDDHPHMHLPGREARPMERVFDNPYMISTPMRNHRPPTAPPPPPPNVPGKRQDSSRSRLQAGGSDVSQLEAFLECKRPNQSDRSMSRYGEASVTESLLDKRNTPFECEAKNLLGDSEEVTTSLLLDHNENGDQI